MQVVSKIILLLSCIVCWCSCVQEKSSLAISTGMENKPLPVFTLMQPDGTSFSSTKFVPNTKLVLFYFSPGCQFCRAQLRETLNNINRSSTKQLCIVLDGRKSDLQDFAGYFKLNRFNNIIIGVDTGDVVGRTYRIGQVPFTAVYNGKKELERAYIGRLRGKELLTVLDY